MVAAYYKRLSGDNEEEKLKCAKAWTRWEEATSHLYICKYFELLKLYK